MNGPETRRQRAQLNAFDATLLQKRDWILKVVVRVLRAIGGINSSRRHGIAVDGFDHAEFIRSNFDQRHFPHYLLEWILD